VERDNKVQQLCPVSNTERSNKCKLQKILCDKNTLNLSFNTLTNCISVLLMMTQYENC